jgi:TonB family protein
MRTFVLAGLTFALLLFAGSHGRAEGITPHPASLGRVRRDALLDKPLRVAAALSRKAGLDVAANEGFASCSKGTPSGTLPLSTPLNFSAAALAYERRLDARIGKAVRFPPRAPNGEVSLLFSLNRSGKVVCAQIEKTSGSQVLDRAALEALKKMSVESLPADLKDPTITFRLPLLFRKHLRAPS